MWIRVSWLAGAFGVLMVAANSGSSQETRPDPGRAAMGIFKAHCLSCHKGAQAAAGLDLSTIEGINKGGTSGKLIVPGKPDASLLMKRVTGQGGLPQMPMGFAPLTKEQLTDLRAWITGGGKLDPNKITHWAYLPPKAAPIPKVANKTWVRNEIDNFILAKLEQAKVKPSAPATKETLIRRLSLDLIGLPPTPAEVDAFVADKTRNAYKKLVDRLLASPHYGERQARAWLDLARYADTNGYEADAGRVAWKYRDWVIHAYNSNMPFDEFTIEQLAGDMLLNPTLDQLIATGFHRNSMLNLEGGVDPKESRYEMVNDRVATTSTVWLGQTVQCARCHDHKYDPISQKEYFAMYAIFNNSDYEPRGDANVGQEKYYEFSIPAPSPEQAAQKKKLETELAHYRTLFAASNAEYEKEKKEFYERAKRSTPWAYTELKADGLVSKPDFVLAAPTENPANVVYEVSFHANAGLNAVRILAFPDAKLPNRGPGRASSGNFILSRLALKRNGQEIPLGTAVASFVQNGYSLDGLFDKDGNTGWAVAPEFGKEQWLVVWLKEPLKEASDLTLEIAHESPNWPQHSLGNFTVQYSTEPDRGIQMIPNELWTVLNNSREGEPAQELDKYYRSVAPSLSRVRDQIAKDETQLKKLNSEIPTALVMREKPGRAPITAPFHPRGEFLQTGDPIPAGIPAAFGKLPPGRVDRLALAKWLVSKQNPLTARVEVNRIWEGIFGKGLVETSENWGTPGTPPTHPELLDWLAVKFMNSGWDRKALIRLIVTSSTYCQSSNASLATLQKDPTNRLMSRAPRYRMEAEMIRDNALAASGLLNPKVGGPSVYPQQPDGVWNSPYSGERWMTSKGADLYRRGLYTYWKRTSTYPTFVNFDASSRESCTVRRIRTNTPLQALNLLNDAAFLEAARALAINAKGSTPREKVIDAFRRCTCRRPSAKELDRLEKLYLNLLKAYEADAKSAKQIAKTPELAAMTMTANVILNLDETITRE
jgi:mono/diheme cytochrome c family protein